MGEDIVRKLPTGQFTPKAWMTHLWTAATENEDPIYRYAGSDEDRILVPPAFAIQIALRGIGTDIATVIEGFDPDWERGVYHGQQEMVFHRNLVVDETYTVEGHISSVDRIEGSAGPFDRITFQFEVFGAPAQPAFEAETQAILMRGDDE